MIVHVVLEPGAVVPLTACGADRSRGSVPLLVVRACELRPLHELVHDVLGERDETVCPSCARACGFPKRAPDVPHMPPADGSATVRSEGRASV